MTLNYFIFENTLGNIFEWQAHLIFNEHTIYIISVIPKVGHIAHFEGDFKCCDKDTFFINLTILEK